MRFVQRWMLAGVMGLGLVACAETTTDPEETTFEHEGGTIGAETWAEGVHEVLGSITVSGGILEVAPCSTIRMPYDGALAVQDGGAIKLVGTADCPITITSSQAAPAAGDWAYLELYASGDNGNNVLDYVVVEYGGGSGYGAIWIDNGASVAISNTTVRDSDSLGIDVSNGGTLRNFTGNTLTDNRLGGIELGANSVGQLGPGVYGPNDVPGILVGDETIDRNATWGSYGVPYVAEYGFDISTLSGSAVLTVAAGATLALGPSAIVSVADHGGLTLAGTVDAPVTVTSSKAAPAAGDWDYIEFFAGSIDAANSITHAVIEYGGGGGYGAVWVGMDASVKITDSIIVDSADLGLQVANGGAVRDFTGNSLTSCALGPMELPANLVDAIGVGGYTPNDIEGIQVRYGTVDHTATWADHGVPYVAQGGFSIGTASGSAILTLEAGTTLALGPGAVLDVGTNGALVLAGTADQHVTLTSAKAVPAPGDWAEIDIYEESIDANVFTFADIEFGGGAGYGQLWVDYGASVTLESTTFASGDVCDVYIAIGGSVMNDSSTYSICPH